MKLVEKRPYSSIEEVTAPPMSMKDPISGEYSVYKNGAIRPSDYEECRDLEVCAVWELEHVIDRLLRDGKWTELGRFSSHTGGYKPHQQRDEEKQLKKDLLSL